LCAALQAQLKHVPTRLSGRHPQKKRLEKGETVAKNSGGITVLLSDYAVHNATP
jgi:hypothetical protein